MRNEYKKKEKEHIRRPYFKNTFMTVQAEEWPPKDVYVLIPGTY